MGNGSVFQLVPLRFPKEIGVLTGVVGAAGGVGGFFLPNVFGGMKWLTGSYGTGFAVIAGVCVLCLAMLWRLKARWEGTFLAEALASPSGAAPTAEAISAATSESPVVALAPATGGSN